MASARGIAHLSRELVNKLVGIVMDERMPAQRKLDQATATLDRVIAAADSPASTARHAIVGTLDDAISAAAELRRTGAPRGEIESRVRAKLTDGLTDLPGVSVEARR
jgi:hypothetical protein